jgi:hypothetical protein
MEFILLKFIDTPFILIMKLKKLDKDNVKNIFGSFRVKFVTL